MKAADRKLRRLVRASQPLLARLSERPPPLLLAAGLSGALGVVLSAVAAHRADLPNLSISTDMVLFHAPRFWR